MEKSNKISKYFKICKDIIKQDISTLATIIYLSIPFIAMDLITRILGLDIGFYELNNISPNLFNLSWIVLFIGLTLSFKKKIGKLIYMLLNITFIVVFLINNIYYSITNSFFDFTLLESTQEGMPYITTALKNSNIIIYISLIFIIYFAHNGYKKIPYKTKNNYKALAYSLILFFCFHILSPFSLGKPHEELTWSTWSNPRNVYISFNDNNKSMQIAGLYEYTFRNFYITFIKTEEQEKEEDILFLKNAFAEEINPKNKYTGIFEGKNLIMIQLEGIDNWVVTEKDTPNLYKLMKEGINFTDHYSYYNGGGSTFNSEFAVNTGFITPLSYTQNAYTFNKNNFPYSLATLLKEQGYTANAFHMNTGEYYSRATNYRNWGYDNYYGLIDTGDYTDESYQLDRELILNEKFNKLMFPTDGTKFLNYIITYSNHTPFTTASGVCNLLYKVDNGPDSIPPLKSEENCIRRQAKETDYMIELLLKNLKEKNLLENTAIVLFSDHYLYTVNDKYLLKKYKETDNNLINKTPFFIWSSDISPTTIKKTTSQLNILPTVLNLMGIKYNQNNYIGKDALYNKYEGIVFFDDYSWYDGNVYVKDGYVTNKKKISQKKLDEKNYYISYITKKNDLALKFNYFK